MLHQILKIHDKWTSALFLTCSRKCSECFSGVHFSLRKENIAIMAKIIAVISMFLLATKHLYEFVAISTAGGSVSLKQSKYRLAQCHTSIITLES